jgi:hypothetical protein
MDFGAIEITRSVKSLPTSNSTRSIKAQGIALKATTDTSGKVL